jgi:hypothetical protein
MARSASAVLLHCLAFPFLAAGIVDNERGYYSENSPRYAPKMDPDRRISEQDCTKPLDYSVANIR